MTAATNRFLEGFSPAGRDTLLQHLVHLSFPAGTFLFHEGDPANGVCLVLEGEVEIVKAAASHETILGTLPAGEYLGEVAVLDGHGRSTGARARTPVSIAMIPGDVLLKVLSKEPVALTLGLLQNALTYLRRTNDLFAQEVVLKERLSLMGEMTNSLMHDSRNPLVGMHLAADLITMAEPDSIEEVESKEGEGMILLDPQKQILSCSKATRHLLAKFFEGCLADQMPVQVKTWLDRPVPYPFKQQSQYETLEIRFYRDPASQRYLLTTQVAGPAAAIARLAQLGLSPRESEVLYWLAQGKRNEEIAVILDLSFFTVKTHLKNIFRNLGVETRTAAAAMATPYL